MIKLIFHGCNAKSVYSLKCIFEIWIGCFSLFIKDSPINRRPETLKENLIVYDSIFLSQNLSYSQRDSYFAQGFFSVLHLMSARLISVFSVSFLSCMLPFIVLWHGLVLRVCVCVCVCVCVSRAEALQSQGEEGAVSVEEQVEATTASAQGAGHDGEVGGATVNPEHEEEEEEHERLDAKRLINPASVLQLASFS